MTCRCGHQRREHTVMSGPNSIGQWAHGLCSHGGREIGPYWSGGCNCRGFRFSLRNSLAAAITRLADRIDPERIPHDSAPGGDHE